MILDAVSGDPVDADAIKTGETVYAWLGARNVTTMSLPPQTTPDLLLVNVPADYKVPQYDIITRSDGLMSIGIPEKGGMSITLSDGTPHWNGRCAMCLSCLHRCPARAIQYAKATTTKGRYFFKKLEVR